MSYNTFFRIAKQSGERILKQSMKKATRRVNVTVTNMNTMRNNVVRSTDLMCMDSKISTKLSNTLHNVRGTLRAPLAATTVAVPLLSALVAQCAHTGLSLLTTEEEDDGT